MRLTIAYFKIKKRNLVLINDGTHLRETLSERPIRLPLKEFIEVSLLLFSAFFICVLMPKIVTNLGDLTVCQKAALTLLLSLYHIIPS